MSGKEINIKGIKKEKYLENFAKALPVIFAASDTRKLVKAASDGDLERYKEALRAYKWKRTMDYNMVLVILSVIVAAAQAVINYASEHNGELDDDSKELGDLVEKILGNSLFSKLCNYIGEGNGESIKSTLENNLPQYLTLLKRLSGDLYGKKDDAFMKRAGDITRWIMSEKHIRQKLLPYITNAMDPKFGGAIKRGLNKKPKTPEDNRRIELDPGVRGTITEQLQEIFNECLTRAASQTVDDAMYDFLSKYDTKGKALYTNDVNKSYPGCKTFTVTDAKNVIFVASDKGDLRMFFNPATFKNMKTDDLYAEGQQCIEKYLAEKNSKGVSVEPVTEKVTLANGNEVVAVYNGKQSEMLKPIELLMFKLTDAGKAARYINSNAKNYKGIPPELIESVYRWSETLQNQPDILNLLKPEYRDTVGASVFLLKYVSDKNPVLTPTQKAFISRMDRDLSVRQVSGYVLKQIGGVNSLPQVKGADKPANQPAPAPTSTTPAQPAKPAQPKAAPQDPRVEKINAYLRDTAHANDDLFRAFKSKDHSLIILPAKIPAALQERWDAIQDQPARNKIVAMARYLINNVYDGLGERAWDGFDKESEFGEAIKKKKPVKKKK